MPCASARLGMRFGPRAVLYAGLGPIVAGAALFARAPLNGSYGCRRSCCSALDSDSPCPL